MSGVEGGVAAPTWLFKALSTSDVDLSGCRFYLGLGHN